MSDSSQYFDSNCNQDCESEYSKCISSKEHESVCRMKRAQCSCKCVIS